MFRAQFIRILLVFAVIAALGVLPAHAGQPVGFAAPGGFSQLWSFLTSLWGKAGSVLDPNGGNTEGQGGSPVENGCGLDPHGICAPSQSTAQRENGSVVDPNGAH